MAKATTKGRRARPDGPLDGIPGGGPETSKGIVAGNRSVREASEALRAALDGLHKNEDEAWRSYARNVDDALRQMECELQVAAGQLRAERADSRHEIEHALVEATVPWRAIGDEVRVRVRLGEMDAHDAVTQAVERLDEAGHRASAMIDSLRHDTAETLGSLRHRAGDVLGELRAALLGVRIAAADADADDVAAE